MGNFEILDMCVAKTQFEQSICSFDQYLLPDFSILIRDSAEVET